MRTVLNAVLIVVLAAGVLAGTAGLSSMHENDHCQNVWTPEEGGPSASSYVSTWPPGVRCELVARDGSVVDREPMTAASFVALLALEIGLLALVLRARLRVSFWLRAAALTTTGLLVWGVASLWAGPVAGLFGSLPLIAVAGFAVDRLLRRLDAGPRRRGDGLLGLLLAPSTAVVGLFVWIAVSGPLGHAVTVALVAAAAALSQRWAARAQTRPAWMA